MEINRRDVGKLYRGEGEGDLRPRLMGGQNYVRVGPVGGHTTQMRRSLL